MPASAAYFLNRSECSSCSTSAANAFNGKPPGEDGGLHDEVKPVPAGNALQLAAFPIIDLQVLRVDGADVPWRKITVVKRGANGFSRQCRLKTCHAPGSASATSAANSRQVCRLASGMD